MHDQDDNQDAIQAGTYRARAVAGSEQYGTTANGHEQIGIDLELLDIGQTVTTILIFSEKSEKYSIDRLKALGWPGGVDDLRGIDANEVNVQIKYEVFEDRETGEPKRVMKAEIVTGGKFKFKAQMDDGQKRAFFSRLKGVAARTGTNDAPPRRSVDLG